MMIPSCKNPDACKHWQKWSRGEDDSCYDWCHWCTMEVDCFQPVEEQCCENCRMCYKLVKFDYSKGGCEHTDMEGYVCMAFAYEEEAVWMVGMDKSKGLCECYFEKEKK